MDVAASHARRLAFPLRARHDQHVTPTPRSALALLALTAVLLTGCAAKAPVSAVDLATGTQDEPIEVVVDGDGEGVGVTFREITIAPGAGTGEHCHYGQLIAVVKQGTFTHYAPVHPGGVAVYEAGDAIIEGAEYVHEGRNEGDEDVILWVTYVIPDGKPLAETELANCEQ
jgi:quercetin dioxygenase-like cupin family protein